MKQVTDFDPSLNRYAIDGLIGLSFLRRFNYEIRSAEGRIIVDTVASS